MGRYYTRHVNNCVLLYINQIKLVVTAWKDKQNWSSTVIEHYVMIKRKMYVFLVFTIERRDGVAVPHTFPEKVVLEEHSIMVFLTAWKDKQLVSVDDSERRVTPLMTVWKDRQAY